jgi:glycerol-1-phosphate dehydrogenase [NAD(P)+]
MERDQLFGQTFSCACGKTHSVEPREVIYSQDAVAQLSAVCNRLALGSRVAVLMDLRTRRVAGKEVAQALSDARWRVKEVLVKDRVGGGWPICDDNTKHELDGQIGDVHWILPVGSGVINDLGKWLAADREVPFVSFATAASMNGYASANVAPTIEGVKTISWARPPRAIFSSPNILTGAPPEMTAAGLGDVLAKTVSTPDWYMNHLLFEDHYCEKSAGLITDIEPKYIHHPEALRAGEPEAIGALFEALLLTGVSMSMAESSSPASGGEHLISHALDMMSSIDGMAHDLHGRQVGIGTVLAAELYRRVLAVESPIMVAPAGIEDETFWGPYGDTVAENYAKKIPRLRLAKDQLLVRESWDQLRQALASMLRPPEDLHKCLASAGAATRSEDIRCSRARLLDAFRRAHEIRSRFTILDLARLLGIMPAAAGEIVEAWA